MKSFLVLCSERRIKFSYSFFFINNFFSSIAGTFNNCNNMMSVEMGALHSAASVNFVLFAFAHQSQGKMKREKVLE